MKITKKFSIEKFDDSTHQLITSFWENRKIKFNDISETFYEGNRGDAWGNITSFDMSKLITQLNISRDDNNEINCELNIKTFGQFITKLNREFWKLELDTFESVLLKNDYKEIEWTEYKKLKVKSDMKWKIFCFIMGVSIYEFVYKFLL